MEKSLLDGGESSFAEALVDLPLRGERVGAHWRA